MQIVFLIKPFSIHMYSYAHNTYTLLGSQAITFIEKESHTDYENRMVYVCKDICQDYIATDLYKGAKGHISSIRVILTNPWCVYEVMNVEKRFDMPQKLDQKFVDSLMVHKNSEELTILKNSVFNVALNGYDVQRLHGQMAQSVHLQYISIYSSKNFLEKLKNTLDRIFHVHEVEIDSIYSMINESENKQTQNQLKIIIEDQGMDLSYVYQNKNIATTFVHFGFMTIREKIKEVLHVDDLVLDKIFKSRSLATEATYEKSLNNIWTDLDETVKAKINKALTENTDVAKKGIREFVETIENQYIAKDAQIAIYCLDENSLYTIGMLLADELKQDAYILNKLSTQESNVFTNKIF